MRRWLRRIAMCLAALTMAWLAGYAWFIRNAGQAPDAPPRADGIVALTGGADRVATALHLAKARMASSSRSNFTKA